MGLCLPSGIWQNGRTHFPICLQMQKCKVKLYMIPCKAIVRFWALKRFASVGSLEVDTEDPKHHLSSGFSAPNDFVRLDLTIIYIILWMLPMLVIFS